MTLEETELELARFEAIICILRAGQKREPIIGPPRIWPDSY
jgi:hypothetical protein